MARYDVVLETERLFMRRWKPEDLEARLEILSDPVTMQHWPKPLTAKDVRIWLDPQRYAEHAPLSGRLALHLKEDGALIGDAGLMLAEIDGTVENDLGYIVHHPWWRKGYGIETAEGLMKFGQKTLRLTRIIASMADDNVPSWRVAERLGMKLEKNFRNERNLGKLTRVYFATPPEQ